MIISDGILSNLPTALVVGCISATGMWLNSKATTDTEQDTRLIVVEQKLHSISDSVDRLESGQGRIENILLTQSPD